MEKVYELIQKSIDSISNQPSFFNIQGKLVTIKNSKAIIVIGDLHGDLTSLNKILRKTKLKRRLEQGELVLIFLGDFIDRGPRQIEVLTSILQLLSNHPDSVLLLRGNHEGPSDLAASPHDFPRKLEFKYGSSWRPLYRSFRELFKELYTACVIENQAMLVHGGIPTKAETLQDIETANITHPETSHLEEILWNDPSTLKGVNYSFRGSGRQFGAEVANKFLEKLGLKMLIRGHECFNGGYFFNDDQILTIHSCKLPHYQNPKLAYLNIKEKTIFTRQQLFPSIRTL
jgi:protein phosphatase